MKFYILKLRRGKWYICKDSDYDDIVAKPSLHAWTGRYEVVGIWDAKFLCNDCAQGDIVSAENDLVKECMLEYGIDNVRGGSYITIELSDEDRRALQDEIDTAAGLAYFENHVPEPEWK